MVQSPETPPEDNNDGDFTVQTLFSQGSALGSNLMPMRISWNRCPMSPRKGAWKVLMLLLIPPVVTLSPLFQIMN
jgi:hypothetical protein